MSFFDDSHILSRLGILDSTEESPRREKNSPTVAKKKSGSAEKESFVEVSINGEAETDSDNEDTLFDQDTLLSNGSKSKVLRRHPESFRCRYFLLMLTYFSLGAVCHSSMSVSMHKNASDSHIIHVYQCIGTLIGVLIGRSAIFRLNSTLFFLVNMLITTSVFFLLAAVPDSLNAGLISTIQRIVIGALSYACLSLYFSFWRGHNRKALWLFALFALGMVLSINFAPVPLEETKEIVKRDVQHEIQPIPPMNIDKNSSEEKAQRPDAAVGLTKQVSKTELNEKMRENQNIDQSNTTQIKRTTEIIAFTRRRTKQTTTPSTTTTTKAALLSTRSGRNKDRFRMAVPESDSVETFVLITVVMTTVLHIFAFVCCCTNCRLGVDPKVIKLRDPSQTGFTRNCTGKLAIFYFFVGFSENYLQMYLSTENLSRPSLIPLTSFVILILAIIPGSAAYSVPVVFLTFISVFISAIGVGLDSGFNLNLTVLCGSLGYLPVCVLLNIESRILPRPILLLDYFFLPQSVGHLLAAVVCWIQEKPGYTELIVSSAILLALAGPWLMISIAKTVRLKEIMEYTSSTPQGTLGEYLALVDRENLSLSDIDEQSDSQEL